MKIEELKLHYCDTIPKELEEGIFYISKKFGVAIHLCACGCGGESVTPFDKDHNGWKLKENEDDTITLRPSIGNWNGEKPYHAHYYITKNKIKWLK